MGETGHTAIRLHSAIQYIAPMDKRNGREEEIFAIRDARLQAARERRRKNRLRRFEVVKEQKFELNESVMNGNSTQAFAQVL